MNDIERLASENARLKAILSRQGFKIKYSENGDISRIISPRAKAEKHTAVYWATTRTRLRRQRRRRPPASRGSAPTIGRVARRSPSPTAGVMGSRVVRAAADVVVLGSVTLLALARLAGTLSGGRQDSPLGTRAAFLSVGLAVLVAGLVTGWKRRTRPMPFAVVCVLAASLDILTRGSQIAATTAALVLLPLAVFAVAAYETRPALRRGVIAAALVLGFVLPILAGTGFLLAALMLATLSAGAAWGYGVRKQREYVAELVARTRIAERERELIAERAARRSRPPTSVGGSTG